MMWNRVLWVMILALGLSLTSVSSWACDACGKTECKFSMGSEGPVLKKQKIEAPWSSAQKSARVVVLNVTNLLQLVDSFLSDYDLSQTQVSHLTRDISEKTFEQRRKKLIWPDFTDYWVEAKDWRSSRKHHFSKNLIQGFQIFDRVSGSRWIFGRLGIQGANQSAKAMMKKLILLKDHVQTGSFAAHFLEGAFFFLAGNYKHSQDEFEKAVIGLQELAGRGSHSAQDLLALCFSNGWGTYWNSDEAKKWSEWNGPQGPLGDQFQRKSKWSQLAQTLPLSIHNPDSNQINEILKTGYSSQFELQWILQTVMDREDQTAISRTVSLLLEDPTLGSDALRALAHTCTFRQPRHALTFVDAAIRTGAGTIQDKTFKASLHATLEESKRVRELWEEVRNDPNLTSKDRKLFATFLKRGRDYEISATLMERVLKDANPPSADDLVTAAECYSGLGMQRNQILPRAVELVLQFLKAGDRTEELLRRLGMTLRASGHISLAITVYEELLRTPEQQPRLQDKLALVVCYAHHRATLASFRTLMEECLRDPSLTSQHLEATIKDLGPDFYSSEISTIFRKRLVELSAIQDSKNKLGSKAAEPQGL